MAFLSRGAFGAFTDLRGWGRWRIRLGTQVSTRSAPEGPGEVKSVLGLPGWEGLVGQGGPCVPAWPREDPVREEPRFSPPGGRSVQLPAGAPHSGRGLGCPTAKIPRNSYSHGRFWRSCATADHCRMPDSHGGLGGGRRDKHERALGVLEHPGAMGAWWAWRGQAQCEGICGD